MNDDRGDSKRFRSGDTRKHPVFAPPLAPPPSKWVAHMMKIIGSKFVTASGLTYHNGQYFFAGQREDGLWVAARLVTRSGMPDELTSEKPYRLILGHTVGGGRAFYVAFLDNDRDNWPRVVWGESEGKPHEVIDHERILWADGEPLYIATLHGQTFVVCGRRESKPCDRVEDLSFVARRPLYRARRGREMFLVWGPDESDPYDDISPPEFNGNEITAWATKSRRLYRLTIKVA